MSFENEQQFIKEMDNEKLIEEARHFYLLQKSGNESFPFTIKVALVSLIVAWFFIFGFKEPNIIYCLISSGFSIFTIIFCISLGSKSKRYSIIFALMIKELYNRGYDVACGETLTISRLK